MDRPKVVVGVGSSLGEGDHVVDLVGEWLSAHVADGAVSSEDPCPSSGFLAAGEYCSLLPSSSLRVGPRFRVGVEGAGAEFGAAGDAAWIGGNVGHAGSFPQVGEGLAVGSCGVLDVLGMLPVVEGSSRAERSDRRDLRGFVMVGVVHRLCVTLGRWKPVELL